MLLYIITRGRVHDQFTLSNIPDPLKERVVLAVDYDEGPAYTKEWKGKVHSILRFPESCRGTLAIRQYLLENTKSNNYFILDDDMTFDARKVVAGPLPRATPKQIIAGFERMDDWLTNDVIHCALTMRSLNFNTHKEYVENTRTMYVIGYRADAIRKSGASFLCGAPKLRCMEDLHMCLQLLLRGHRNRIDLMLAASPRPSNKAGGAQLWRTLDLHNETAQELARMYPGFVRLKKAGTVADWANYPKGKRMDVQIEWAKAYKSSQGLFGLNFR